MSAFISGVALGIAFVSALLLWPFVHGWLKGLRAGRFSIAMLGTITVCSLWLGFHPRPLRNLALFVPMAFCAILFWLHLQRKSKDKPSGGPHRRSPAKAAKPRASDQAEREEQPQRVATGRGRFFRGGMI